jgi:ribosomal protein S18 acetylase RimI-like enzyme
MQTSVARVQHRAAVVVTVVAAFRHDPAFRFFFPDDERYDDDAAAFSGYLFDKRVDHGTVWMIGEASSVAMWSPPSAPGIEPADAAEAQTEAMGSDGGAAERIEHYESIVGAALPATPHWYLGILATHPDHAGQRLGRRVMGDGLARASADGVPAILETTRADNVALYERAGWSVEHELVVDDLDVWILSHAGEAEEFSG